MRQPAISFIVLLLLAGRVQAQQPVDIPPAVAGQPFSDRVLGLDAELTALRVTTWDDGPARMMLLDGDARFRMGTYGFEGNRAVVRIERQDRMGQRLWHLAIYLTDATPLAGVGPVRAEAGRLMITATTTGAVRLDNPGLLERVAQPPDEPLITDARQRLAELRRNRQQPGLAVPDTDLIGDDALATRDARRAALAAEQQRVYRASPGGAPSTATTAADGSSAVPTDTSPNTQPLTPNRQRPDILPARGTVAYAMDAWAVQPTEGQTLVSLIGDVRLVFEGVPGTAVVPGAPSPGGAAGSAPGGRVVTLKAQRVVLFLDNEADADTPTAAAGSLDASAVSGVYLEDGATITDGDYTVRAPRVYYDLARNQAVLLDAVFYTYDLKRQIPLYVRAARVRQTSATDFAASDAKLTTSEFAVPHFSIGANELQVSEYRTADDRSGFAFVAEGTTLNLGKWPFFYWPRLAGYVQDIPLRRVSAGYSSDTGVSVRTSYDVFALLGRAEPDNVDWTADLDYRGTHGPALGTTLAYDTPDGLGNARAYLLPDDSGTDEIGGRLDVEHSDDVRGFARAYHRSTLPRGIELSLQGAYVSDETFLEEFFPREADEARPYETSAYLKWQDGDTATDLLAATYLSDFNPQLTPLQVFGYRVERYPELGYRVLGRSLFDDTATLYSQTTVSQLRIDPGDDAPSDRGFDVAESNRFFGIDPGTTFTDRAEANGLPLQSVRRLDTRHELAVPLSAGALDVTPYAVGRLTAYDESFEDFNGGDDDQIRLFGELGVRVGTEFSKASPDARSDILDVDGLRHVVAPSATFFVNGATLGPDDLPVYDPDVESLADGAGMRLGVTQTWQTRRGGAGRQRTVDWVTLKTDAVFRSGNDDADGGGDDAAIARFYDYRPEYSAGGDHLYAQLLWLVTDTLGAAGEVTHSLEDDRVAQWRLGITLDHSPRLRSFLSYAEIESLDSRLLTYGFDYQLTTKYRVGASQTLDFSEDESRSISLVLDRKLPRWTLRTFVSFDEIEDEQRVGIALVPDGARGGRVFGLD